MIKVAWPMDWPQGDAEVCEWLGELVMQSPGEHAYSYSYRTSGDSCLHFEREEDAIAFKLKYGYD